MSQDLLSGRDAHSIITMCHWAKYLCKKYIDEEILTADDLELLNTYLAEHKAARELSH